MSPHASSATTYSVVSGARQALKDLRSLVGDQIPPEVNSHLDRVSISTCSDGHKIYFPCPFKENEAAAALKAVEAGCSGSNCGPSIWSTETEDRRQPGEDSCVFILYLYSNHWWIGQRRSGSQVEVERYQTPSSILINCG